MSFTFEIVGAAKSINGSAFTKTYAECDPISYFAAYMCLIIHLLTVTDG